MGARTSARNGSVSSWADGRTRLCPKVLQPPIVVAFVAGDSNFGPTGSDERAGGHNPPRTPRLWRRGLERRLRDTQADVPSAERLRAQLAFKNSMVRGILQFTPSIAFRCVLHRCESRDIRCRESFWFSKEDDASRGLVHFWGRQERALFVSFFLGASCAGVGCLAGESARGGHEATPRVAPPSTRASRGPEPPRTPVRRITSSRVVLLCRFRQ